MRVGAIRGRFEGSGREFLQGPPTVWAEQLTELSLAQGMSAYLLIADSAEDIERFAGEVAPAVREQVALHRRRHSGVDPAAAPVREAAERSAVNPRMPQTPGAAT